MALPPNSSTPTYLIDGVSAVAIHNGVARVEFMRLTIDGKPESVVELAVPLAQVRSVIDALVKART